MARIYVAGPLFGAHERTVLESLAQGIESHGHRPVVPHREVSMDPVQDEADARARYDQLIGLVESCDAVVAMLDGLDADAGTCLEVGFARALGRPVLGLRTDIRSGDESDGLNLMVAGAADVRRVASWDARDTAPVLQDFLGGVRVFAGRLVRDGVPRMVKEAGKEVAFAEVDAEELPKVLKRRLVEVARRLETTEFGVEQEVVVDVLEVVEALIRVRKYDKESLRNMKESLWRKRGGYEKGYVVEEEPQEATEVARAPSE